MQCWKPPSEDEFAGDMMPMKDSIIDVSINERHTLIERCFNHKGTHLGFFVREGTARLQNLSIAPLTQP